MNFPYMYQPTQQVIKVNGENGARAFAIGANSSALLLDESGLLVWLITTDGAGYKTVTPYDITPHKIEPAPDSLESRVKRLEEIINANTTNPSAAGRRDNFTADKTTLSDGKRQPRRNAEPAYADESTDETGY